MLYRSRGYGSLHRVQLHDQLLLDRREWPNGHCLVLGRQRPGGRGSQVRKLLIEKGKQCMGRPVVTASWLQSARHPAALAVRPARMLLARRRPGKDRSRRCGCPVHLVWVASIRRTQVPHCCSRTELAGSGSGAQRTTTAPLAVGSDESGPRIPDTFLTDIWDARKGKRPTTSDAVVDVRGRPHRCLRSSARA